MRLIPMVLSIVPPHLPITRSPWGHAAPRIWLDPIDRLILLHGAQSPQPVRDLLQHCSRGSLYRHLGKLLKAGAVRRIGRTYVTTSEGVRWMADAEAHLEWNVLEPCYPPLAEVPTEHHKALLQLIAAAVVVRQAGLRDDHHPAFGAMGRTLKWKTSCGRFACYMFGVDPQVHIIDLGSETTGSLFTRRSSQGWLVSQRSVLTSPFVGFDDVLQAEAPVRAALAPFVSGRRSVPFEQGLISIDCVSFVTMNPRDKSTLEAQTTFNPAQLRRLVLLNCDAVPGTVDLALSGHRALDSAQQYGPLRLPAVRTDLREHRTPLVHLIRTVVRPEMHERIDTDLVLLLAAGMSGFVEQDEQAIQQTVHALGLILESHAWVTPAWSTAVSQFSLYATRHVVIPAHPSLPATASDTVPADRIILRRRLMDEQPKSRYPDIFYLRIRPRPSRLDCGRRARVVLQTRSTSSPITTAPQKGSGETSTTSIRF